MSKDSLQLVSGDPQVSETPDHAVTSRRDLTGQVLSDRDLMAALGVSHGFFYARKKQRLYEFLMCRPQLAGRRTQYSGTLVQLWIDGAGEHRGKPALVKRGANARRG